jgi:DNA-binding SARP family transcriptional activator/predicted ATPase
VVTAKLRLLGPPSLIKAGRSVRLHSAKTLALLAYLILEANTSHSREKLGGLLWGESPEPRARQSLRQALYSLRQSLGAEYLVLEADTVAFEPHPDLAVDALEFMTLAPPDPRPQDLVALQRAASLYQGLLLEGLELSDCPAYAEWLFFQRDALEQRAVAVLQALADGLLRRGDYSKALGFAQKLVILDPLHEGAHCYLMQVYAALGDLDNVRRQYRTCTTVLDREMGVEPSTETQALYHQLTTARPSPISRRIVPPGVQLVEEAPELPFLGREHELTALLDRLNQAVAGEGGLILVAGEAGMGKTGLLEEFAGRSTRDTARSVRCLIGRCYELEVSAPYTVWGDALHTLSMPDWEPRLSGLAEAWRRQLARLVPELGPPADDIQGVTIIESRLRLHQGILQSLIYLTGSGPLLLCFDDLHWADQASLELLHYISRHATAYPLLLVGTYRLEEVADRSYLGQLLRETDGVVSPLVLELGPLEPETIGHLLMHLGTEWPVDLPDRFHQHSAGNPLLLTETLRALIESGTLHREPDGCLVEREAKPWPVPRRVHDLIQARLVPLSDAQRRVLAAAAVIGRPFGLRLLRRVCGLPEPQVLDLVEQLLGRVFLDEKAETLPGPSLDFHHDYLRRVIYEGLSAVQRRALHRRTARALLELHRTHSKTITEEVAYHYEQASDLAAIRHLSQAAQYAEQLFAYHHATQLYGRALIVHSKHLPHDLAGRFDLLLAREAVLDRQGRRAEQRDNVAKLVETAETLGDTQRLAAACVRQAGFHTYTREYSEARQAGQRALALYQAADDKAGEAQALRELGFLHWSAQDYGTALSYGREALALHRRLGDLDGEATALHNLAEIHRSLGSPRQALAQYENALNLHWARQDRQRQGLTLYGMAHALRQLGDTDRALSRYQQALDHCRAAGDRLMTSRVHHTLAGLQSELGGTDQAHHHMQQALDISRQIGYGPGIAHGLIGLCHLQARRGNLDLAGQHLQEAITWLRQIEDQVSLTQAQAQLKALERGTTTAMDLSAIQGWVKAHVALAEGKVYCEFESPTAQSELRSPAPRL